MPSVGELSMRMSADSRGLVSGFASATQALQSFDARARTTSMATDGLSKNFEKLSRATKAVGAFAIAARELGDTSENTGTKVSEVANKVQGFAESAAIFAPPKLKILALGVIVVAEAVKYFDRSLNSLSAEEKAAAARRQEAIAALEKQRQAIEGIIKPLEQQLATYGMTERELLEHRLATEKATAADIERATAIFDKIAALDAEKKATEEAAKADEERFRESVKHVEEIAARRQNAADAIDDYLRGREEMRENAGGGAARAQTPGIARFGSQDAFSRIGELTNEMKDEKKEFTDELRKQTKLLSELVKKLGGTGEIEEAIFP